MDVPTFQVVSVLITKCAGDEANEFGCWTELGAGQTDVVD
jgi:hypothetical protein